MYHTLLIYSSVDGHLPSFQFLAIKNNAAVSIDVEFLVRTYVFISLGYIPRSGIGGSYVTQCLTFWETIRLFSNGAAPLYIPTSSVWGFRFLQIFTTTCYSLYFLFYPSCLQSHWICLVPVQNHSWVPLVYFSFQVIAYLDSRISIWFFIYKFFFLIFSIWWNIVLWFFRPNFLYFFKHIHNSWF